MDAVISSRACEIALPDGTRRSTMGQRNLHLPVALLARGGAAEFALG
jgi:hypothetical protein